MSEGERALLERATSPDPVWLPFPGTPQLEAYLSEADYLFYGGAAGGGKTDLMIGLGITAHTRSIIFRREGTQFRGIEQREEEIIGSRGKFNAQKNVWKLRDPVRRRPVLIEHGAVQYDDDWKKYQGRPHDLLAFDEAPHFNRVVIRTLRGWVRSSDPQQRTRTLLTGNPPTCPEEEWIIEEFAPWLDEAHPRPAKPGELRWYYVDAEGNDVEVQDETRLRFTVRGASGDDQVVPRSRWKRAGGGKAILLDEAGVPVLDKLGEPISCESRTVIFAKVTDNPVYMEAGYMATLNALPEPLRSQMRDGLFHLGREDNPWQVIPTAWVEAAQRRWKERAGQPRGPLSAVGVDVAQGGEDETVLAARYGTFFDTLDVHPGKHTPTGGHVAGLVEQVLASNRSGATANIDAIGVGSSAYDTLRDNDAPAVAMVSSEGTEELTREGTLRFANKRALWWWRMREALDPDKGEDLALPPDRDLKIELCAPRWKPTARGILVEAKEDIRKRLGRSTNRADSVVYGQQSYAVDQDVESLGGRRW